MFSLERFLDTRHFSVGRGSLNCRPPSGTCVVFLRESHLVIPGKAGIKLPFPGNSRDAGNCFFLHKFEKSY
jgi:hypothetical protein